MPVSERCNYREGTKSMLVVKTEKKTEFKHNVIYRRATDCWPRAIETFGLHVEECSLRVKKTPKLMLPPNIRRDYDEESKNPNIFVVASALGVQVLRGSAAARRLFSRSMVCLLY